MEATYKAGRYAALDIGTVTCRLLVADVSSQGILTELAHGYRICNLGEDTDATGVLKPQAMQRVLSAVDEYLCSMKDLGVGLENLTCMATSASRDAENAAEFQGLLAKRGVKADVIPGETEAALSFRGASSGFEGSPVLVVDIGGVSTEVVAGIAGQKPAAARSFNVGCRRLTERFSLSDMPAQTQLAQAREWVHSQMAPYFQGLFDEGLLPARMVAVAGTATSVVSVDERMDPYDSARVHHAQVSRETCARVHALLTSMNLKQRKAVVGLDPGRAPVIVAGTVILQEVMDLARVPYFVASEADILQGMVLSAAQTEGI